MTTTLGIDIRDRRALAVLVGPDGAVRNRASVEGADVAAATAAAREALGEQSASAVGLALREPSASERAQLADAVAGTLPGATSPAVVTPGNAIAIAEHWCGAARGANSVVALTAGDGVHSGMVIGGRLFTGAHAFAGSAAWLALNPVEREDYRKHGCLEAEVDSPSIVRRLVWRIKSGDESRVLDMAGGQLNAITVEQIFEAARAGDGVAISVVRDTAKYIGMAIANLVAIVDPEMVVLGGVIAEFDDLLLEPSRAEMVRRVPAPVGEQVAVVRAALGDESAAIGAARAAMTAAS